MSKTTTATTGITAREYFAQVLKPKRGHTPSEPAQPAPPSLSSIAKAAKIPLSTLRSFLRTPSAKLTPPTAIKLQKWSNGEISAARTLGLEK